MNVHKFISTISAEWW